MFLKDLTTWFNSDLMRGTGWYMCFKHRGCSGEEVSSLSVQSRDFWRRRSFKFFNYMIRLNLYNLLNLIESGPSYSWESLNKKQSGRSSAKGLNQALSSADKWCISIKTSYKDLKSLNIIFKRDKLLQWRKRVCRYNIRVILMWLIKLKRHHRNHLFVQAERNA